MIPAYFVVVVAALVSASVAIQPPEASIGIRQQSRVKRQKFGDLKLQDPYDPKYTRMAQESFNRNSKYSSKEFPLEKVLVTKVTTQVVDGIITRIDFFRFLQNGGPMPCHCKVLEQPWLNIKKYTVKCDVTKDGRMKRYIPGGIVDNDPNDPEFLKLAKEALEKFRKENTCIVIIVKSIKVTKASTQVVSGIMRRIEFTVNPGYSDGQYLCKAEILEQTLNKKDITVNCVPLL